MVYLYLGGREVVFLEPSSYVFYSFGTIRLVDTKENTMEVVKEKYILISVLIVIDFLLSMGNKIMNVVG